MKAWFKALWKRSKWVLLAVGGVLVAILAFVLRGLFVRKPPERPSNEPQPLPPVDERIHERVKVAEEEATVARIEAKVKADTDREQLDRINTVEDGAERRRRLAAMLRRL
jgi:hypothetical protein